MAPGPSADDRFFKIALSFVVLALLMFGASLLIVAVHLGAALVSSVMLIIFQWVFSIGFWCICGQQSVCGPQTPLGSVSSVIGNGLN